ncbi:hypothetical protein GYMLUDRAFT_246288 [Collybiopsis luxurians FD-317 M1]|uniref:Unplaced genomic scaffold GYMLUscaffold_38, whole genome shotgun sequence n=1 Tax=Collybiopsis luxurians FD-317 M1 TaxID=944289 RepID=A0A0D0CRL1_9AGAR|nr:hypothetical protein GYMLUDRAFT_246288 [Collybiopsis luxurians FD-317 M1]
MAKDPSLIHIFVKFLPQMAIKWLQDILGNKFLSFNKPDSIYGSSSTANQGGREDVIGGVGDGKAGMSGSGDGVLEPSKCRKPKANIVLIDPINVQSDIIMKFPKDLLQLADYNYFIPLAWFTPKNLLWISANIQKFKRVKLTHIKDKPQVLDTDDVSRRIDECSKAGPSKDKNLTYTQWQLASDNYLRFKVEVYRKEDTAHPQFLLQHYKFWD